MYKDFSQQRAESGERSPPSTLEDCTYSNRSPTDCNLRLTSISRGPCEKRADTKLTLRQFAT